MAVAFHDKNTGNLVGDGGNIQVSSSMTIEELEPSGSGLQPRKLLLVGPGLPFMGAEWGFENNVITTWYPGNSIEATQQNLGPKELPSSWEGEWKRTLMGTTPSLFWDETGEKQSVFRPHTMRDIVEDLGRSGVPLRVTWEVNGQSVAGSLKNGKVVQEQSRIVRVGRIKSARFPHDRHTDVRWNIEFHWMSRGGRQNRVADVRGDQDLSSIANSLIASAENTAAATDAKLKSSNTAIRKSANNLTLGQLEQLAKAPTKLVTDFTRKLQQNVSSLKQAGDIVKTLATQPFAVANTIIDFARNTVAVANNFVDDMGRIPIESKTTKEKASSLARSAKYFGQTSDAAMKNAREAQTLNARLTQGLAQQANRGEISIRESATSNSKTIIAVYIAKDGDTPQRVSMKYYQSADHAQELLKANKLPWFIPTFTKGQILIIPSLVNASRSV